MSEQLSTRRLAALLRNEVVGIYRSSLIGSAAIAGLMLLSAVYRSPNGLTDPPLYNVWFAGMLVAWGTIASSFAFSALHNRGANISYLLLPASALEKTLAPLLVTTVALVAYLLLFISLVSFVIETFNGLVLGTTNGMFHPFDGSVWFIIPQYLVVQSWFFLGAAWFRKAHFIKTLLAIVVASLLLVFLSVLASWVAGSTTFTATGDYVQTDPRAWLLPATPTLAAAVNVVLVIAWFVALPVFCWYVAWLRVKETQVSHGV
jgi:hypothetical protein